MRRHYFLIAILFIGISCSKKKDEATVVTPPENPSPNPTATDQKESTPQSYTHQLVVDGIDIPWGLAFISETEFLVTEKSGTLYYVENEKKFSIDGLPSIYHVGQGGLLDIEVDPNFSKNQLIYFTLSFSPENENGGNTALYSAQIDLESKQLSDVKQLFRGKENTTREVHFGSRIIFDHEGYLYLTIGDRGQRDVNPQSLNRDGGKVHRLNRDGSIPSDNPFVNHENANPSIFSYGHRNPQGMLLNPLTDDIWIHEHGPRGGDEINIIEAGKNYGWPKITYGKNYNGSTITNLTHMDGMEQPLHHWTPSIAPSGFEIVTSERYGHWKNHFLVGSLKFSYLERLVIENNKVIATHRELNNIGRVRSIEQGLDGYIYVGVESLGVVRIVPKE
ncbi:MAG: PQQ-dependent sugar dehydrogenase [Flavobacteriaceae bacterium]|nr:PQQ-dependent sugar dehydrogenase [Flavobacteriaceae bacterium]